MAIDMEDFNHLVNIAMEMPGRTALRPVIEKELLHYDILFALDKGGHLDALTFQGGTSLRLCYGAHRFSEDLDFTGGTDFKHEQLQAVADTLTKHIGGRYGFEVIVKSPAQLSSETAHAGVRVDKWQISVVTQPGRRDLPRQRIKLEVASVPAYTKEPRALIRNYDFLPDGYEDLLIMTESLDEIMADKLISLPACQNYVRHRDIWDLRWLQQKGAEIKPDLVAKKTTDYHIDGYEDLLQHTINNLPKIVRSGEFKAEMRRFLPDDVWDRTFAKPEFSIFLTTTIGGLLSETKTLLSNQLGKTGLEFRL